MNLELITFVPAFFSISITFFMCVGWLFGRYRLKKNDASEGMMRDSLLTAIFGLSALVLGFTFSNASNHYDIRNESIRAQANAIKEVYVSTQYLQSSDQTALKESLRELLSFRINAYSNLKSLNDIDIAAEKIAILVRQINVAASKAVANASAENKAILFETFTLPMRNLVAVFNLDTIKTKTHPPVVMMRFLYALLCVSALLIGYTMALNSEGDWFLSRVYVLLMGLGLYVILSLVYPNLLMPFDEFNKELVQLKSALSPI